MTGLFLIMAGVCFAFTILLVLFGPGRASETGVVVFFLCIPFFLIAALVSWSMGG